MIIIINHCMKREIWIYGFLLLSVMDLFRARIVGVELRAFVSNYANCFHTANGCAKSEAITIYRNSLELLIIIYILRGWNWIYRKSVNVRLIFISVESKCAGHKVIGNNQIPFSSVDLYVNPWLPLCGGGAVRNQIGLQLLLSQEESIFGVHGHNKQRLTRVKAILRSRSGYCYWSAPTCEWRATGEQLNWQRGAGLLYTKVGR